MSKLNKDAESTIPVTGEDEYEPAAATGSGNQPDYKALYEQAKALNAEYAQYKDRFAGLQGKYQQEQDKWKKDVEKLTNLEQQFSTLTGEKEALGLDLQTHQTKLTEKERELAKLIQKHERLELISTEYPELLSFYKDGLLPEGNGEELRTKLANFRTKLSTAQSQKLDEEINKKMAGATPETPGSQALEAEQIMAQAFDALRSGNADQYEKLMNQYYQQTAKPEK